MVKEVQEQTILPGKLIELQKLRENICKLKIFLTNTEGQIETNQQQIKKLTEKYCGDKKKCPEDIQTEIHDLQKVVQECEQHKQECIDTLSLCQNRQKELGGFFTPNTHLFPNPAPAGKDSAPSLSFGPKQA